MLKVTYLFALSAIIIRIIIFKSTGVVYFFLNSVDYRTAIELWD